MQETLILISIAITVAIVIILLCAMLWFFLRKVKLVILLVLPAYLIIGLCVIAIISSFSGGWKFNSIADEGTSLLMWPLVLFWTLIGSG